ncbi:uracil-DNA glycosylase [Alkalihalobacillus trypoxylicola]|uniref:Uracil-DNA glycosylase n=1 Tax=Alkalihalobacillus trypoxylicola TaxID=519424 RepID=A0A161QIH2_9BACI|nr:uracil-DNA glycosylase [Alkalihalobacillus trypoxylicola]
MIELSSLIPHEIHPSWKDLLSDEVMNDVMKIETEISDQEFNPTNPRQALRFLSTDLNHMNIIWLGQDVYPAEGVATGRAFEVGTLHSWTEKFNQNSIQNIIRVIHKNYFEIEEYKQIKPYTQIRKEIESGQFPILQPKQWFQSLENQGVLFLNCSFTCKIGKANSHKKIWESFSNKVLQFVSSRRPDLIWFLWGKEAINKKVFIQEGQFYESRHPMLCSEKYENDFLKFNGFKDTGHLVNWLGIQSDK